MKILAIDLGGMSAKVGLLDENGIIYKKWKISTQKKRIWENIKENLTNLKDSDYDVVGISMPGFIDHQKNKVILAGNLDLKNYDILKNVTPFFAKKPVFALNDANAAALGEFWMGASKNDQSSIFYTLGTGIGGAIVIDGKLVTGVNGYAGEFGHGGFFQKKWPCTCGLKHCVEPLSSATGISRLLKSYGYNISIKEAAKLWKQKNLKIEAIFIEALTPLAKHIATMETAFNPNSVIIGGGPSQIGEILRLTIEKLVQKYQLDFIAKSTKIKIANTKNNAGIYGAAYWALEHIKEKAK